MAVINCPQCRKKISDKAKSCSHCGVDLTDMSEEKLLQIRKMTMIEKSQRLMNISFVAMLMFCGGFLFLYSYNAQPGTWQYIAATTCTVLGFILYIVIRVWLVFLKKSSK